MFRSSMLSYYYYYYVIRAVTSSPTLYLLLSEQTKIIILYMTKYHIQSSQGILWLTGKNRNRKRNHAD